MVDYSRRRLLGYSGAMVVLASVGGQFVGRFADAAPTPALDTLTSPPSVAFLALSRMLTGYATPDVGLARRLYNELRAGNGALEQQIAALCARLSKAPAGPFVIDDQPALAMLYRQIMSGWYLGVIGPADAPRCIGFENIVSYRVVAPTLSPPSYCSGEPNFWAYRPG